MLSDPKRPTHRASTRRSRMQAVPIWQMATIAVVALSLGACASQGPRPGAALANTPGANGQAGGPVTPGTERDFSVNVGTTVYFTTDSTDLTPEAAQTLRNQVAWLKQYPQYTITLEGHADERGTREYNIALGARRATTVRQFLASQGVNPARLRTISYGKERPVAVCNDISCWSQNRRSETKLNRPSQG